MVGSNSAGIVITGTVIMGALAYKGTDLVKYLVVWVSSRKENRASRDEAINGVATISLGALVGVVVVMVMSWTDWSDEIQVGKHTLGSLSVCAKIMFGLALTGLAGTLFDFKKALDSSDSASTPKVKKSEEIKRRRRLNLDKVRRTGLSIRSTRIH